MVETIVVVCIVAIIASLFGALIALRIERGAIQGIQAEHEAWEQAQENYRRTWERKQAKRFADAEAKFAALTQSIREDWEAWKKKDTERIEALAQQYETLEKQSRLEQELARLPHVEEMPLGEDQSLSQARSQWHPAILRGVDLSGRDLSHRYLRSADLREARLVNANLFMSDLSGALLTSANLQGADLSGANLSGADLRDAILADTNLQVADLRHALLVGANLIGARHLSKEQLAEARYDDATRLDDDTDLTEPQLPIVRITAQLSDTLQVSDVADAAPIADRETDDTNEPTQQQPIVEAIVAAPVIPELSATSPAESETTSEIPLSPTPPDEPAFDEQPDIAPVEIGVIPETPLPLALEDEPSMDEPAAIVDEQNDPQSADAPALLAVPEASFASLLPDLEALLESSADSQFFSPLAPNGSLLDLHITDQLVEQQEETPTVEAKATTSRPKHGKSRRSRATNRG
jgi:type II secretory pathway pseudopilin PulG